MYNFKQGRWTKEEHFKFLEALKLYGKEWRKVQMHVGTRTSTQARSHAQKFFYKLDRRNHSLQDFLDNLELADLQQCLMNSDCEDYEDPDNITAALRQGHARHHKKKSILNIAIPAANETLEEDKRPDRRTKEAALAGLKRRQAEPTPLAPPPKVPRTHAPP